jgi:pantetheine-phosphate adenylyltransferase
MPGAGDRLEFASFDGLLVEFCSAHNARVIVRGLRALADFEYEFQFAHMNRRLAPGVDTVFFMTDERNHYVSSSLVKEVASLGGDVTGLVPAAVVAALRAKYRK